MNQYDEIIISLVHRTFPQCPDWLWVKAQIWAESGFNPNAISSRGAQGLMQLMPDTAKELGVTKPFDPYDNIRGGVKYMRDMYNKFGEIPDGLERYFFALASYNGGPGYINVALKLARKANNLPMSYQEWSVQKKPGTWQTWAFTSKFLSSPECVLRGKHPIASQITDYVEKISRKYEEYRT